MAGEWNVATALFESIHPAFQCAHNPLPSGCSASRTRENTAELVGARRHGLLEMVRDPAGLPTRIPYAGIPGLRPCLFQFLQLPGTPEVDKLLHVSPTLDPQIHANLPISLDITTGATTVAKPDGRRKSKPSIRHSIKPNKV